MNKKLKDLSWQEKMGQLFMIGLGGKGLDSDIKKMILDYKIGGIILYRKDYASYSDMLTLVNELKECNRNNSIPLFIATDQEGGRCNRMPKEFQNLLSPTSITKKKDITLITDSSKIIATMLKETGINLNFAPVLDIKRFEDSHPIGNRCYGNTPEEVCQYGISAMKVMQEEGILPVIKHFPGHGATTTDSHVLLPKIKQSMKFLEENDILPFKTAIQKGADAIMVGHLMIKEMSKCYPSSLSRACVTNYLRNQLEYQGLIITDDLKMKAIQILYGSTHATKCAFCAGNDIIINRVNYASIIKTMKWISKKAKRNPQIENRVNESVNRILNMKEKYQISDDSVKGCNIEKVNEKIARINKKVIE